MRLPVELPQAWQTLDQRGAGPFVTLARFRLPSGEERQWEARRHRKGLRLRSPDEPGRAMGPLLGGLRRRLPSASARARLLNLAIAGLFLVGSFLFALGSAPGYAAAVTASVDGLTFVLGSIFFTSAAGLQLLQAQRTSTEVATDGPRVDWTFRGTGRSIGWWAAAIQFVGTLLFNLNTVDAYRLGGAGRLGPNLAVWTPDVLGSACFLIASYLAVAEVCHAWWGWRLDDVSWWVVQVNLLGSVLFGLSALGAFYPGGGDQVWNTSLATAGTFLGAVCFFVGALLLVPEAGDGAAAVDAQPAVAPA